MLRLRRRLLAQGNPWFSEYPATIKTFSPTTTDGKYIPTNHQRAELDLTPVWKYRPVAHLSGIWPKSGGRDATGTRRLYGFGGGLPYLRLATNYQYYQPEVPKQLLYFEFPRHRRSAWLGLVHYANGVLAYHPLIEGMKPGAFVFQHGVTGVPQIGQWRQLKNIPATTTICSVEFKPGGGAQIARTAGSKCMVLRRSAEHIAESKVPILMPSREIRLLHEECWATIGRIACGDHGLIMYGKAGKSRQLGRKPIVRGLAMQPPDHPHAGSDSHKRPPMLPRNRKGKPTGNMFKHRKCKKVSTREIIRFSWSARHYLSAAETQKFSGRVRLKNKPGNRVIKRDY